MKVQKIIRLEQDRACLMCGVVTPAGADALPLALHFVICLECCEKAAYAVWIHGLGGPALSAAIQAAMPAVAIHQQHAEVLPECTAVDMIPLSEGPPQSCALRGPHTEHVSAAGHRFTVPEKPSCPQEHVQEHGAAVLPDDQLWPVPGVPRV